MPIDTLTSTYEAWQRAEVGLRTRGIAAIARVAQEVLAEPLTGSDARPNAAARRAWALLAVVDPGRSEPNARWPIVTSAAYTADGAGLSTDALLDVVRESVDSLALLGGAG